MSTDEAQTKREVTLTHHTTPSGKLSIITLNRASKYNALAGGHYRRLAHLMHCVNADTESVATVLIGTGSFFSAGADVTQISTIDTSTRDNGNAEEDTNRGGTGDEEGGEAGSTRNALVASFARLNLYITHEFAHHIHPLFVCLNGPVIGLSASLVAFGDFILATEGTYLLTPFASLGLAPEGGASFMFPLKMGWTLATRALVGSERISCDDLLRSGFITRVFPADAGGSGAGAAATGGSGEGRFKEACLAYIQATLDDKNIESMRIAKSHMWSGLRRQLDLHNVREVFGAVDRFEAGIPQTQFMRLANKEKKHKL